MAILLAAITVLIRLVSPHTLFPAIAHWPLVPVFTGMLGLSAGIGALRHNVSLRPPLYIVLQWILLGWILITLLMNGVGGKDLVTIKFINDILFATLVALVVDRLTRFKLLVAGYAAAMMFISLAGVPQIWAPRMCGEVQPGTQELIFDTRVCTTDVWCDQKPPPRAGAPAERHFRCERRGPFDITAYQGRMRWVSVFSESNALASMCTTLAPLLIGWGWTFKRRRVLKWMIVCGALGLLGAAIFATGSRGALLGLLIGVTFTLWRFLGKRVLVAGALLGVLVGGALVLRGGSLVQRGDETDLTGKEASNESRTGAMAVGMRLWGQYPIFGIGHSQIERYHLLEAHNGYISAASELGTPGLFLFVLTLWINFRSAILAHLHAKRSGLVDLSRISAACLGGLIGGTFSFTVFLSNYATLHTLTLALIAGGMFRSVQNEQPELRLRLSYWDFIGAAVAAALIMGVTHVALSTYFTISGYPLEYDTSSGTPFKD